MILEIRGSTGVGKSTLMRNIIHAALARPVPDGYDPEAYFGSVGKTRVAVLGRYDIPAGGLENSYRTEETIGIIDRWVAKADAVFLESGYLSKLTGSVYEHLRDRYRDRYRILWLFAEQEVCLDRLRKRRARGRPPVLVKMNEVLGLCQRALERIDNEGVVPIKRLPSVNAKVPLRYVEGLIKEL